MNGQKYQMEQLAGIVLCGGMSRRMGRPKADLPFGKESLLQRVVNRLATVTKRIVLVTAQNQPIQTISSTADLTFVQDELEHAGPLVGLQIGLKTLLSDPTSPVAAYVTSCDVPFLKPEFISALFRQLGDNDVVVPRDDRFVHPLAAVYRLSVSQHISSLIQTGERKPRALFEHVATLEVPTRELRDVDPELATLTNLNTPHDYRAALSRAGLDLPSWVQNEEKGHG